MGFFGFGKKDEIVDLGERYRRQQEREARIRGNSSETQQTDSGEENAFTPFTLFGDNSANSTDTESETVSDLSEKKRRLAKRLVDMTTKIEDLSNQIYHLQQRIEVLEKKSGPGSY